MGARPSPSDPMDPDSLLLAQQLSATLSQQTDNIGLFGEPAQASSSSSYPQSYYGQLIPNASSEQGETTDIPRDYSLETQEEAAKLPIIPSVDQVQVQGSVQLPEGIIDNQIQHGPGSDEAQSVPAFENPVDWDSLNIADLLDDDNLINLLNWEADPSLPNVDLQAQNPSSQSQPELPTSQPNQGQTHIYPHHNAIHQSNLNHGQTHINPSHGTLHQSNLRHNQTHINPSHGSLHSSNLNLYADLPHFPHLPTALDPNLPLSRRLRAYPQLDTSFVFYSNWLNMLALIIHEHDLLPCLHPSFEPQSEATAIILCRKFMFTLRHLMTPILFQDLIDMWLELSPSGVLQVLNRYVLRNVEKNLRSLMWQVKEPTWEGTRKELKVEVERIVENDFMAFFRVHTDGVLAMLEREAVGLGRREARHDGIMEG